MLLSYILYVPNCKHLTILNIPCIDNIVLINGYFKAVNLCAMAMHIILCSGQCSDI